MESGSSKRQSSVRFAATSYPRQYSQQNAQAHRETQDILGSWLQYLDSDQKEHPKRKRARPNHQELANMHHRQVPDDDRMSRSIAPIRANLDDKADQKEEDGDPDQGNEISIEEMQREDRLLLKLKESSKLSWKQISENFKIYLGKEYSIHALQMWYRRLQHRRISNVSAKDYSLLMQAHEFWTTKRWDIISQKMAAWDADDIWTPNMCAEVWLKLTTDRPNYNRDSSEVESPAASPWQNSSSANSAYSPGMLSTEEAQTKTSQWNSTAFTHTFDFLNLDAAQYQNWDQLNNENIVHGTEFVSPQDLTSSESPYSSSAVQPPTFSFS